MLWSAGPTAVALKQRGPWTYGALANHLWSFAGGSARDDISSTFLQPFVSFATPTGISYTLQTESTYNWKTEEWNVPVMLGVGKVTRFGDQLVQITGGLRYYVDSPSNGPEGFAFRLIFTLLYPKQAKRESTILILTYRFVSVLQRLVAARLLFFDKTVSRHAVDDRISFFCVDTVVEAIFLDMHKL